MMSSGQNCLKIVLISKLKIRRFYKKKQCTLLKRYNFWGNHKTYETVSTSLSRYCLAEQHIETLDDSGVKRGYLDVTCFKFSISKGCQATLHFHVTHVAYLINGKINFFRVIFREEVACFEGYEGYKL